MIIDVCSETASRTKPDEHAFGVGIPLKHSGWDALELELPKVMNHDVFPVPKSLGHGLKHRPDDLPSLFGTQPGDLRDFVGDTWDLETVTSCLS